MAICKSHLIVFPHEYTAKQCSVRAGFSGDSWLCQYKFNNTRGTKNKKKRMTYTRDSVAFDVVTLKTRKHIHIRARDEALDFKHAQTKYILQVKPHIRLKRGLK